ncbi:TQO small subunit DoxD [Niabella hibiscisoli]|uniref:TQO small subunit DoxD n=1 Tax=Niabella hibiscisoli TaxID=1825928 RepID=UPI001F0EC0E9|nr:TQO small subunit DoxD [Niabella hibiscisoli]MCH5720365.1 DoxX family membrane protein [Niabella hibiscisoli]
MKLNHEEASANAAGLFTLALRWVIGWTYFSAFWRRLILENKLIPGEAGYIGEKFNHFLPNALGIKPIIEYLVSHPDSLYISMIAFTIIEAVVGLLMILGLFTRLMSIGVMLLALGILLGSGWLGTTCLDEWQIGVLGIAGDLPSSWPAAALFYGSLPGKKGAPGKQYQMVLPYRIRTTALQKSAPTGFNVLRSYSGHHPVDEPVFPWGRLGHPA